MTNDDVDVERVARGDRSGRTVPQVQTAGVIRCVSRMTATVQRSSEPPLAHARAREHRLKRPSGSRHGRRCLAPSNLVLDVGQPIAQKRVDRREPLVERIGQDRAVFALERGRDSAGAHSKILDIARETAPFSVQLRVIHGPQPIHFSLLHSTRQGTTRPSMPKGMFL
jgi:hypothetical protein